MSDKQEPVSERIKILFQHFGNGNLSAFAREIGVSAQAIRDLIKGEKGGPSWPILQSILRRFPSVSTDWLVLGYGEMIRDIDETRALTGRFVRAPREQSANSLSRKEIEELVQQITATHLLRTSTPEDIQRQKLLVAAERIRLEAEQKDLAARIAEIEWAIEATSPPPDHITRVQLQELKREAKVNENSLWLNTNDVGILRRIDTRNMPLEAQAVYRVTGEPDPAQHFGGLLTHRLNISEEQALQLLASKQIRGVEIEGVGYRVTERAVRELLGEA